ncbi:MucR family transcriptional regulator [Sphingobium sp. DC-2]|uniref:MucR family transcriptional regulator n=1 Tax=Sphingobium sp. DC-2 TaxID=1303256 RepID=UPI0005692D9A|nr:MucR family transcriptional regulator [Sphingobium sp. DC-2]
MSENMSPDITTLTVQLLSAFVSNNSIPSEGLADLIRTTRSALTETPQSNPAEAQAATYTPAVSVRKSLSSPEHILSMIDGKPYKTLKRHLATHGLSPDQYRERYNLPKSYPLVAPSYSEARRAVANKLGLGRKPVTKAPAVSEAAAPAAKPVAAASSASSASPAPASPAKTKTKAPAKKAAPKAAAKPEGKSAERAAEAKPAKAASPRRAKPKAAPAAAAGGDKA